MIGVIREVFLLGLIEVEALYYTVL